MSRYPPAPSSAQLSIDQHIHLVPVIRQGAGAPPQCFSPLELQNALGRGLTLGVGSAALRHLNRLPCRSAGGRPRSVARIATVAVARGVRACATTSVQWSSTPYGYEQCIHRGAFQNQLRLGRIGRFQNLKSSRPQPLSVRRTEDCIFFHDQDDRFFRKGHRSTTRLKQETPGGVLQNLLQCLVTSCAIESFSIFGDA
jgi:hypothetical protein